MFLEKGTNSKNPRKSVKNPGKISKIAATTKQKPLIISPIELLLMRMFLAKDRKVERPCSLAK